MNELQLRQEAHRLARQALNQAAGRDLSPSQLRPTVCLMEHRVSHADVPEGTQLIPMRHGVATQLFARGLREPVSLTHLKGLWWVAHVDAAHKHSDIEFGGAYCTVVASTMDLIHQYSSGYVEVTQGPFDTAEEAQAAMPSW